MLVSGITIPDALMHQLVKVPALVSHYYHHITAHQFVGMITFLEMHYGDQKHQEEHDHEHNNLPGKGAHHECQHVQVIPVVIHSPSIALYNDELITRELNEFVDRYLPASNSSSIWQPPKKS